MANNYRRVTNSPPSNAQVRQAFGSYAEYYVDAAKLPHLSPKQILDKFECEGRENIEKAQAKGNGVIMALPHMGSWEWAGAWLHLVTQNTVTSVVEAFDSKPLLDFMIEHRKKFGIHVIPTGRETGKHLIKALKENRIICLLADRYIEGAGMEIEFFGEKTMMPVGPATLSLRTGAPILPSCIYRKSKTHKAIICPGIDTTRKGTLKEDIEEVTIKYVKVLEELIQIAPKDWHLMTPNWPSDKKIMQGK